MSAPEIELKGIKKNFGATEVIRDIDLAIVKGERHAIIGPNGAGKSTLFALVSGLMKPTSGTIWLKGEDITRLPPHLINRRGLSRSFQVTNIFHRMSVWENVRCGVLWSAGHRYTFWRSVDSAPETNARTEKSPCLFQPARSQGRGSLASSPMPSNARSRSPSPLPVAPT